MSPLPTVADAREATRLGASVGLAELQRRAALVIRCTDCGGRTVAVVAWLGGRPLAAAAEMNDRHARARRIGRRWAFTWADRGTVLHLRCRARRHVVDLAELRAGLPPPGRHRAEIHVRH